MLQPNQFVLNEAWIFFRLNDAPLRTRADGDFDFFALMDAASGLILGSLPVSTQAAQPSAMQARQLLEEGRAEQQALPATLFIPTDQAAQYMQLEAEQQGITVIAVPLDQLLLFIGAARQGFRERFGAGEAS